MSPYDIPATTVQTAASETQKYLSKLPDAKAASEWVKTKSKEALRDGYEAGKAAVYEYAYAQARDILWQVSQSEIGKKITEVGNETYAAGVAASKTLEALRAGKLDANGVVDIVKNTEVMVGSFATIAQVFGASPQVVAEVKGWANVAVGCAAAGTHPPLSIVACAAQVVIQTLSTIFGMGGGFTEAPAGEPRAVFYPAPGAKALKEGAPPQGVLLHVDSERLASLLRYQYGVGSAEALVGRLTRIAKMEWWRKYPSQAVENGVPSQNPPVGMDMLSWLVCLDRHDDPEVSYANVRCCLDYLSVLRTAPAPALGQIRTESGLDGEELVGRTADRGDVSVAIVELGAWVARGAIVATGAPRWRAHVNHTNAYAARVSQDNHLNGRWAASNLQAWNHEVELDFYPFLVADELLNYFTAICNADYETACSDPGVAPARILFRSSGGWPIRFRETGYNPVCWTTLSRARRKIGAGLNDCYDNTLRRCQDPGARPDELGTLCLNKDQDAMKELAFIRLLSAASMLYMRLAWRTDPDADPIADLPEVPPSDPLWLLRAPVGPHQARSLDVDRRDEVPPLSSGERWELLPGEAVREGRVAPPSASGDYLKSLAGIADTGGLDQPLRSIFDVFRTVPRTVRDGRWLRQAIAQHERDVGAIYLAAQRQAMADNIKLLEVLGPAAVLQYAMMRDGVKVGSTAKTLENTTLLSKSPERLKIAVQALPEYQAECARRGGRWLVDRPCPVSDRGPCGSGSYYCDTSSSNLGPVLGIAAAVALWLKFRS